MLNVENNKNVGMLKNVDTKINFFDTNNFVFDKEFKKFIINQYFYKHLFSFLVITFSPHVSNTFSVLRVVVHTLNQQSSTVNFIL